MADPTAPPPGPALPPELDPRRPVRSPRLSRVRPSPGARAHRPATLPGSTSPGSTSNPRRWPRAARALAVLLALAAIAGIGLGLLVAQLAPSASKGSKARPTPGISAAPAPAKTAGPAASAPTSPLPGAPLPLAAVSIVDRVGDEGARPAQAALAHDGDEQTAWITQRYATSDFGGLKPGAGLLVDLGRPTALSAVKLRMTAAGAAVDLRTAESPGVDPATAPVVVAAPTTGTDVTLAPPRTAVSRYWVVWLTRLPADGPGFRVGVAEMTFTS